MKTYACLTVVSIICWSLMSNGLTYEGDIDFAYSGGAYMMDKSGYEDTVIGRFVRALLTATGLKRQKVRIRNVGDEKELYRILSEGRVAVASVSRRFFENYESELQLIPLVVPEIGGNAYIHYCVIARTENLRVKDMQDLWGKRVSFLNYTDYWYSEIVQQLELPDVIVKQRFPGNASIVLSVLNKHVDAGILSDYYLNTFLSSYPNSKKEIKIIKKTKRVLIPPIVYQKGKLTAEEARNIVTTLESAHNNDQMGSILLTMGFSGFRSVTREEIMKE